MLKSYGFIYVQGPGTDPAVDRVVIERGDLRTTIVAVPEHAGWCGSRSIWSKVAFSSSSCAVSSGSYGRRRGSKRPADGFRSDR